MKRPAPALPPAALAELFRKSGAERWALAPDEFAAMVEVSVRHAFPEDLPSSRELDRYLAALHLPDLALAGACALGRDAAWDHFVLTHRPVLYRAADALSPGGGAREIADSLYADLYGVREKADARASLFRYFHGRSSLATWLRSVLAQRYVDALRAQRRTEPLQQDDGQTRHTAPPVADPDRERLVPLVEDALRAAVDRLAPRDRLRLRSYYVAQLTLAQIGRITGEHEATVSRHLMRIRRGLREAIERHLRDEARLSDAQVTRALEVAVEDPGALDLQQMFTGTERKKSPPDRSR